MGAFVFSAYIMSVSSDAVLLPLLQSSFVPQTCVTVLVVALLH